MTTIADTNPTSQHPAHGPLLAHHFESQEQQYDAGKLGMWIFLVTEVLFFSGLFVVYAVYRSNHPEVFIYAHQHLNKTLGAMNTIVLLCSSLTMAWAVRCAQLNQRLGLVLCLAITLACAGFFLGVKAVEYSAKWNEGLLWAGDFQPAIDHAVRYASPALFVLSAPAALAMALSACCLVLARRGTALSYVLLLATVMVTAATFFLGIGVAIAITAGQSHASHAGHLSSVDHPRMADAKEVAVEAATEPPRLAGVFFSIYYAMTGVHAIHILAGMGVIGWLLYRSARGDFDSNYFGPVDYVGLYWHLVDLVWIYLFPLLYLIH